jgi:predicted transcriptional regulator
VVPAWYHKVMAMNLRLSDEEATALRRKAAEEGRSMQEVARSAISEYVSARPARLRAAIERIRTEDAELLDRLSR